MGDRPRVTFAVDSDAWGGAERYVAHHARRASAQGWDCSLVCASAVALRMHDATGQVPMDVVPLSRHEERAPLLQAALAGARPDVVVVNLVDPCSNAAALTAAECVAPTVGVLHLVGEVSGHRLEKSARRAYPTAKAVLSPSAEGRHLLVSELGVPPSRAVVVPNGVDVPPVAPPLPQHETPVVAGLGRLTAQKGFDVLVQAVRLMVVDGLQVDVRVAGAGRERSALVAQASGLPVRFVGFCEDVPGFLSDADVFCLPSRREALPLALLEAMAHARPCVATDVGDVTSLGDGAVIVPADDPVSLAESLRPLIASRDERSRWAARARAVAVERGDADLMTRRTFAVLDAVRRGLPPPPQPA